MHKILLTGASGFIGTALLKHLGNRYVVQSVTRKSSTSHTQIKLDLSTHFETFVLDQISFDSIIHLAAQSNVAFCEKHPIESHKINVDASVKLARYASLNNIPYIFTSSDQVYAGRRNEYKEIDTADPINIYGMQKRKAEQRILAIHPKAVILRLSLVIGKNGGYAYNLINALKIKKKQLLFTDEIRSVIAINDVCQAIESALTWNGGLYNIGGSIALNRYDIGLAIANKHALNENYLIPAKQIDAKLTAKRPKKLKLNCRKAIKAGFKNTYFKDNYLP